MPEAFENTSAHTGRDSASTKFGQTAVKVDAADDLDPRSRSIAEKRAIGLTHGQIAKVHHVSTKTVQRTMERPEIEDLVLEFQSQIYAESTARLLSLSDSAVDTLESLMRSESDSVRLRAASKVIDLAGPLVAHRAMEQRFMKLAEQIEARIEEL